MVKTVVKTKREKPSKKGQCAVQGHAACCLQGHEKEEPHATEPSVRPAGTARLLALKLVSLGSYFMTGSY